MQNHINDPFGTVLLILLIMLVVGHLLSLLAKKINLPEICGQLLAGILLGPTVFGLLTPNLYQKVFPIQSVTNLNTLFQLSLIMTMFTAGLEVELSSLIRDKKATIKITCIGILLPFICGYFFGNIMQIDLRLSIFLGIAFSITALPVIIKILLDTGLISTQIGSIVMSTAILTDLIGLFAFGLITQTKSNPSLISVMLFIVIYILLTKTLIKYKSLFILKCSSNSYRLSIGISIGLALAICCHYLHLHPCLGAFLGGICMREFYQNHPSKVVLTDFVDNFFSPLFFVSIGLNINFIESFNLRLILFILIAASMSKVVAVHLGARLAGIKHNNALLIAIISNARGAIEIIFSTIALEVGIISPAIYVALIALALISSVISGIAANKLRFKFSNYSIGYAYE